MSEKRVRSLCITLSVTSKSLTTMAPPRDDKIPPSDESDLLLSGGHASTYDGIQIQNEEGTDDHLDDHAEEQSVFTSIADNVSTMASAIHDGMEFVAEAAVDMKDAVVEAAFTVEHVVEDIAEELQATFVEIMAPDWGDEEEEVPAEDEGTFNKFDSIRCDTLAICLSNE